MRAKRQKNKSGFRVGQTVQSIYDVTHTFVIDKSAVPERIFHEKGSNRWWTRNELQRVGAAENPATSIRLNGIGECVGMRAKCVRVVPERSTLADVPAPVFAQRECLGCRITFQPTREWQRFHSTPCRYAYWQRQRSPRKGPRIVAVTA